MDKCTETPCENLGYGAGGRCPTHHARDKYGRKSREENLERHSKCKVSHCPRDAEYYTSDHCVQHLKVVARGEDPELYKVRESSRRVDRLCWVQDCLKRGSKKGLCAYHYKRARTGKIEVPEELGVTLNPPCTFTGCVNIQEYNKLCHSHNEQLRAGKELKELRDYGKYIKGEHVCGVTHCNKSAITSGLCLNHHRGVSNYKMTPEEIVTLFENRECQNPGCNNTSRLHIDHNHATGRVRGLLCSSCNTSLGSLGEDRDRITGLITYLDTFDS